MSELIDKMKSVNQAIKHQRKVVQETIPRLTAETLINANDDPILARRAASAIAPATRYLEVRPWEVGMTTKPGDVVSSTETPYTDGEPCQYIYCGKESMTHTNELYYPGAQGVYYWAIVPRTHRNGTKIYPNNSVIPMSVKQNEIWYDETLEHKWSWNGTDNDYCVWPPQEGNEWTMVD